MHSFVVELMTLPWHRRRHPSCTSGRPGSSPVPMCFADNPMRCFDTQYESPRRLSPGVQVMVATANCCVRPMARKEDGTDECRRHGPGGLGRARGRAQARAATMKGVRGTHLCWGTQSTATHETKTWLAELNSTLARSMADSRTDTTMTRRCAELSTSCEPARHFILRVAEQFASSRGATMRRRRTMNQATAAARLWNAAGIL